MEMKQPDMHGRAGRPAVPSATSIASNRPKSALRRRTVDRDEVAAESEDDEDQSYSAQGNVSPLGQPLGPKDSAKEAEQTCVRNEELKDLFSDDDDVTSSRSSARTGPQKMLINHQGVQNLFADILFPASLQPPISSIVPTQRQSDAAKRILAASPSEPEDDRPWTRKIPKRCDPSRVTAEDETEDEDEDDDGDDDKDEPQEDNQFKGCAKSDEDGRGDAVVAATAAAAAFIKPILNPNRTFSLGYPELQKASGLRVLQKVVDRQHRLERDEESLLRQLRQRSSSTSRSLSSAGSYYSRKPPARLKPLHHVDHD